jgi:hypothetical protein
MNQTDGSRFFLLVAPAKAGVQVLPLVRCWLPPVQARGRPWVPAFEAVIQSRFWVSGVRCLYFQPDRALS